MHPLMRLAMSRGQNLVTQTFTANTTWVAPALVTLLNSVVGKGSDGTSSSVQTDSYGVINVSFRTDTNTGAGNVTWSSFQGLAETVAANINAHGTASWTYNIIYVWPDGKNAYAAQIPADGGSSTLVPGSAVPVFSSGWQTSGVITDSGSASVSWQYTQAGAAGTDTTGFGFTFPGGAVGTPASPGTYNNVAVTPGSSYTLVVPAGGSITITYYQ